MSAGVHKRGALIFASVVVALCAAAALVNWLNLRAPRASEPGLVEALSERGTVAIGRGSALRDLEPRGTRLVVADTLPGVRRALAGDDPRALAAALTEAHVSAIAVDTASAGGVAGQMARYELLRGLRGLYMGERVAVYAPEPLDALAAPYREAMATVARRLLEGARPPRITSFPEALRRVRHVEVMVLLKQGPRPRLWRSARGSSLGRALVTAATVARERWQEREAAMGGPIDDVLPRLTVEVALLMDDGTLGDRSPGFVDRAVTSRHGVAYERKGAWRYLLPAATRDEGKGRASVAFASLFEDNGLSPDSLDKSDLRPYRLAVTTLAVSPPPANTDGHGANAGAGDRSDQSSARGRARAEPEPPDGLSEVLDPGEVLE